MKNFHKEFPRVFDRVPFVSYRTGEFTIGCGRVSINMGKWFINLELF